MVTTSLFKRILINAVMGVLVFGTALWTTHVVFTFVLRVFFGVREYSSLSADVAIIGMIWGTWFAFGGSLGYSIASVVFNVLRSPQPRLRYEARCAIAAALAVYLVVLALSRFLAIGEFLRQMGIADEVGFLMVVAPWTLVAVPSTLLVFSVANAIERRGNPQERT